MSGKLPFDCRSNADYHALMDALNAFFGNLSVRDSYDIQRAFVNGWRAAQEYERHKPDSFGEAFNSGDGSYRP